MIADALGIPASEVLARAEAILRVGQAKKRKGLQRGLPVVHCAVYG